MNQLPSYPPPAQWEQSEIPKPPGRRWWIATAVCHLLNAVVFAFAVWACVHWVNRSQTQEYYDTHRGADPDGMMFVELFAMLVCLVAACAVAYAIVGAAVTVGKYQAGPHMLWIAFLPTAIAGALAIGEVVGDNGALRNALVSGLLILVTADLGIGTMASTMRQRPKRQRPVGPPRPAPYTGGSPYLR